MQVLLPILVGGLASLRLCDSFIHPANQTKYEVMDFFADPVKHHDRSMAEARDLISMRKHDMGPTTTSMSPIAGMQVSLKPRLTEEVSATTPQQSTSPR